MQTILRPQSIDDVIHCVRAHDQLQIVGACTKSAMTVSNTIIPRCMMTGVAGIVEHQPSEFMITALAGTPVAEMQAALAKHGQYLPFDPPFSTLGATIGGTVAAGLSGAGRLRFGGLRDFIVGIRIVDGLGNLVTGGGHVVKNAAGYDLPKLMVGSGGSLAAIVDVTLKVFPRPTDKKTVCLTAESLASAVQIQALLSRSPIELAAMDLTPEGKLWLRIEGELQAIETTCARIEALLVQRNVRASIKVIEDEGDVWTPLHDGSFANGDDRLVRIPLTPSRLLEMDASFEEMCLQRRYSVAGNLCWLAWPASRPIQQLDECLRHLEIGGTVLTGDVLKCRIGLRPSSSMTNRIKLALDPGNRFVGA